MELIEMTIISLIIIFLLITLFSLLIYKCYNFQLNKIKDNEKYNTENIS